MLSFFSRFSMDSRFRGNDVFNYVATKTKGTRRCLFIISWT
jgi:hypothetical protein